MTASIRIGDIARQAGVSPDTLRHYERRGLLPRAQRSKAGYRFYSSDTVEQVRRIRSALAIGFTIEELARVYRVRERGGAPCREVRQMAMTKLAQLEERIEEMVHLHRHLKKVIKQWDAILARTPAGERAHLLQNLNERSECEPDRAKP